MSFLDSYSLAEDELPFVPGDRLWRVSTLKFKGDKRISLSKVSNFYALESIQYDWLSQEGNETWAQLLGVKKRRDEVTDEEETNRVTEAVHNEFAGITLDKIQPAIAAELTGDFPPARINWFAVYITCTDILLSLGNLAYNSDPQEQMKNDMMVTGVRLVEMFLHKADKGTSSKKAKKAFPDTEKGMITGGKLAIEAALKEKKTADYVWQV